MQATTAASMRNPPGLYIFDFVIAFRSRLGRRTRERKRKRAAIAAPLNNGEYGLPGSAGFHRFPVAAWPACPPTFFAAPLCGCTRLEWRRNGTHNARSRSRSSPRSCCDRLGRSLKTRLMLTRSFSSAYLLALSILPMMLESILTSCTFPLWGVSGAPLGVQAPPPDCTLGVVQKQGDFGPCVRKNVSQDLVNRALRALRTVVDCHSGVK